MSTRRRKGLAYGFVFYLILLGLVAIYHYGETHRVYATDKTASKAKTPAPPAPPIVAVTSNREGKPAAVLAPVPSPKPAHSVPGAVAAPKPVAAQPVSQLPAVDASSRVSVPDAPSNLTPGAHAQHSGQVNYPILGPGSVGVGEYYDTTLGSITKVTASSYLGNHHNAGAIEVNGGPRIARLNLTYGLSFTDHQRVKLSAERLEERLNYDFVSGTSAHWDGQTAIGGGYDYLVKNHYLQSVGIAGYFSHADSRDLSDASFTQDGQQVTENRRIAGANAGNVHINVAGHLWPYSRISGGADYDTVHFNTQYSASDQDVHGFGGHAKVEQRLWPSVKVVAEGHWQQVDNEYLVGVNWLMPSPRGMQFELEGTTDYYDSLATNRRFYTNGVRLNANFGVPEDRQKAVYSDLSYTGNNENLLDWTRTPAVRMTEVLAVADSAVASSLSGSQLLSCPSVASLQREKITTPGGTTQTTYVSPDGWIGTLSQDVDPSNLSFNRGLYESSRAGLLQSTCRYLINGTPTERLILHNPDITGIPDNDSNWQSISSGTFQCGSLGSLSPDSCQFTIR